MTRRLRLTGYRSFEAYEVSELGRLNLFLGENSSGKTSLLEAAEFLASGGDPWVLVRAADRRGEISPVRDSESRGPEWATNITHVFHGHDFLGEGDRKIRIEGSHDAITIRVRYLDDEEQNGNASLFEETEESAPSLGLEISGARATDTPVLPIGLDGTVLFRRFRHVRSPYGPASREAPRTRYLAPGSLGVHDMRSMWDRMQIEGRESDVVQAVRLVAEHIKSLHFLVSEPSRLHQGGAGILARLTDDPRRVPLGSLGDGIRRILALSLSIIDTSGGCLLVDELDSGLHWSVMRDMWSFLIQAAVQSSVQVMATSHSLDCLRALASLHGERPDLSQQVSVFKLDRRLVRGVRLDADEVEVAVQQGIELR